MSCYSLTCKVDFFLNVIISTCCISVLCSYSEISLDQFQLGAVFPLCHSDSDLDSFSLQTMQPLFISQLHFNWSKQCWNTFWCLLLKKESFFHRSIQSNFSLPSPRSLIVLLYFTAKIYILPASHQVFFFSLGYTHNSLLRRI